MKSSKEKNNQLCGLIFFLLMFIGLAIYILLAPATDLDVVSKGMGTAFCIVIIGLLIQTYIKDIR